MSTDNEMLDLIEQEIQKIIDSTGSFDQAFPANQLLLQLKEAWGRKDYLGIQLLANKEYKALAALIPSKTPKANEKNILATQRWISSFVDDLTPDNPIIMYANPKTRKSEASDLAKALSGSKKEELANFAAELIIEVQLKDAHNSLLRKETAHLKALFDESQAKRIQKGQKTSNSIRARFSENDAALEKIYKIALQNAVANGQDQPTFLQFTKLIRELKSKPAYIRKPRLTKEEKLLSGADLEYVIKEKTREDWSTSTVRNFYEERSGIKATTLKK